MRAGRKVARHGFQGRNQMPVIDSNLMINRRVPFSKRPADDNPARVLFGPDRIYLFIRSVGLMIFLFSLQGGSLISAPPDALGSPTPPAIDLTGKPVPHLAPGTLASHPQRSGYSHLVTLAMPRLASGSLDSLPEYAKQYASMFHFTALANVKAVTTGNRTDYLLDRFGVGTSMKINGQIVVVTPQTASGLGLNLRMVERGILKANEKDLSQIKQIARTSRMIIFDVPTNMLVGEKHQQQLLRYFVWASPATGKIGTLVWRLKDTRSGDYAISSNDMQLLPPNYTEDRAIHVSKGPLLSKIPSASRFALVTIPQGTSVPFSPRMRSVAALKKIGLQDLRTMMSGVSESLTMVPPVEQANNRPAQFR